MPEFLQVFQVLVFSILKSAIYLSDLLPFNFRFHYMREQMKGLSGIVILFEILSVNHRWQSLYYL